MSLSLKCVRFLKCPFGLFGPNHDFYSFLWSQWLANKKIIMEKIFKTNWGQKVKNTARSTKNYLEVRTIIRTSHRTDKNTQST